MNLDSKKLVQKDKVESETSKVECHVQHGMDKDCQGGPSDDGTCHASKKMEDKEIHSLNEYASKIEGKK